MKKYIRLLVPPIFWTTLSLLKEKLLNGHKKSDDYIFDGEGDMFKKHISFISHYAEYGVGKSTKWAYKKTNASILSVDTSKEWIETVKGELKPNERFSLKYFDVGTLGDWGKPLDYSKRENFINYINSIWEEPNFKPELILVDGRFRVACFLNALLRGEPGTKIIFDDYRQRPQYHLVEEILQPTERFGRQALFVIPGNIDKDKIKNLFEKFIYVID